MGWSFVPAVSAVGMEQEEALGVLMTGVVKNFVRRPLRADAAGVHDDNLVTQLGDDAEIRG